MSSEQRYKSSYGCWQGDFPPVPGSYSEQASDQDRQDYREQERADVVGVVVLIMGFVGFALAFGLPVGLMIWRAVHP